VQYLSSVPGPNPTPVLGASVRLLKFALDPIAYIGDLFNDYGPVAALVRGAPTRVVSTDSNVPGTVFIYGPELNRELFTNHDAFHKCGLSGPLYPEAPVSLRKKPLTRLLTGLFHVNGQEHKQQRRLLMPAFHKSRIESYRDAMVEITEAMLATYRVGETRDVLPDMTEITLRIATKTLFGTDIGDAGVRIGRDLKRWLELFGAASIISWDAPGMPYRRWLDLSLSIDRRMADLVRTKRKQAPGGDMLSMLIQATDEGGARLSEDELIGHAGVIFAAGHETSSNALCWTLFLLSQDPKVMSELASELDTTLHGSAPSIEQLSELRVLDRVVKESMRLFPPAPLNHRIVAYDTELGGHRLLAGTEVMSSGYHTHRLPEFFPEPLLFRPDRWQGFDPGPYAYSPFGAGPRMCIGATFALIELKIVLSILLQRFRFELAKDNRIDRFLSITLAPKHGLKLRLHAADGNYRHSLRGTRGNVSEMVRFAEN
jgi:cytochrome P450